MEDQYILLNIEPPLQPLIHRVLNIYVRLDFSDSEIVPRFCQYTIGPTNENQTYVNKKT